MQKMGFMRLAQNWFIKSLSEVGRRFALSNVFIHLNGCATTTMYGLSK